MARDNHDDHDDKKDESAGSAHKVWLAGLGALAAAGAEGEKLFHALVKRGQTVEKQVQGPVDAASARVSKTVKQARERAGGTLDSISNTFDDTVSLALGRLGVPTRSEIASLSKRVEELTRAVEGRKNRQRRTQKPAPKSAAKVTAKQAAGRKTTARKTTRATKHSATT